MGEVERASRRLRDLAAECLAEADYLTQHAERDHATYAAIAQPVTLFTAAALRAERAASECRTVFDLDRADAEAEALTLWIHRASRFRRLMDATWYIVRKPPGEHSSPDGWP